MPTSCIGSVTRKCKDTMNELAKRSLELTIQKISKDNNIDFTKTFTDINVKFYFQKMIGSAMFGKGRISICGLEQDTIQQLTSFVDYGTTLNERKLIQFSAGYGEKKALIFNASILSAIPTIPPDIWLNCDVINGYELQQKYINISIEEGLTLEEYCQTVADKIGVPLEMRVQDNKYLAAKMSETTYYGNIFRLLNTIENKFPIKAIKKEYGNIVAYIDNGTLIVDYSVIPNSEQRAKQQNIVEINQDTGMVGLPEISMAGYLVNITTLLNPTIKTGDVINLTSSQIPSANGLYSVIGITYNGEFRGNSWYTTLTCRRVINE